MWITRLRTLPIVDMSVELGADVGIWALFRHRPGGRLPLSPSLLLRCSISGQKRVI